MAWDSRAWPRCTSTSPTLRRRACLTASITAAARSTCCRRARAPAPALKLPLAGRIAAGLPVETMETPETISLHDVVGNRDVFALEVRGDSMRDEHIINGDYVLVERTRTAAPGRNRRRPGPRLRDHAQALLPRGQCDPPAARQRRDGAHLRPRRASRHPGPRARRAAQVPVGSLSQRRRPVDRISGEHVPFNTLHHPRCELASAASPSIAIMGHARDRRPQPDSGLLGRNHPEPVIEIEASAAFIRAITAHGSGDRRQRRRLISFPGATLAPAFFDIHFHGAAGHDVMEATPEASRAIGALLARHGTATYLATTVTAPLDATLRAVSELAQY